ncbi:hypothetical protein GCM10023173_04740 [Sphingobacterium thermophilum]|uniref:Uncharacterized protein n=2 Tax=Sphingobacterium thermophilum TaxID=768534 RepID=A0ABP8QW86_9SPHI
MNIMKLFNWFKGNKDSDSIDANSKQDNDLPEIKKEVFIEDRDPSTTTFQIEFGTKLPIDLIYAFLKEDYEQKGYNDAIISPDKSYKEKNLSIIKSNIEIKFKQVTLKYEDMLRNVDFHIKSRSEAGLTDLVELLKSKKQTYENHLEEINKMKSDLERKEPYIMGIFDSYEVGFSRGLASLSLDNLKID